MQTVIGAFDDRATAQRAVDELVRSGLDRSDVHVEQQEGSGGGTAGHQVQQGKADHEQGIFGGFFTDLFGLDNPTHADRASTYTEAVRRGTSVVVVDAQDERQADQAADVLHRLGAVDVDERAQQWRSQGWTGGAQTQDAMRHTPAQLQGGTGGVQPMQQGQAGTQGTSAGPTGTPGSLLAPRRESSNMDTARSAGGSSATGGVPDGQREGVLDVVEEQLQVGKRAVERGGVRVVQRVSQKPVRELIKLREERAVVERRPVDREATAADLANFQDRTVEVRESAEEAVVSKTARVVEEVRVGKEVREREETIEDSVRRKDVEVERLGGQAGRTTTGTRERAVAADESSDPPLTSRDPGATTGKPRKNL
jgi:uncharacterized protein (TIGR02271 family)